MRFLELEVGKMFKVYTGKASPYAYTYTKISDEHALVQGVDEPVFVCPTCFVTRVRTVFSEAKRLGTVPVLPMAAPIPLHKREFTTRKFVNSTPIQQAPRSKPSKGFVSRKFVK